MQKKAIKLDYNHEFMIKIPNFRVYLVTNFLEIGSSVCLLHITNEFNKALDYFTSYVNIMYIEIITTMI
jgi:hypothetical protein